MWGLKVICPICPKSDTLLLHGTNNENNITVADLDSPDLKHQEMVALQIVEDGNPPEEHGSLIKKY